MRQANVWKGKKGGSEDESENAACLSLSLSLPRPLLQSNVITTRSSDRQQTLQRSMILLNWHVLSRVATVPVSVPFSVPSKICKKFPVLRF